MEAITETRRAIRYQRIAATSPFRTDGTPRDQDRREKEMFMIRYQRIRGAGSSAARLA
jgi:hypothetical protein